MIDFDINTFCASDDDPRAYIHWPKVLGGYTYATNGALLLRIKGHHGEQDHSKLAWKMANMFHDWPNFDWQPLPTVPWPKLPIRNVECRACKGTGYAIEVTCPECKGEPAAYWCPTCDGEPVYRLHDSNPCTECDGHGYTFDYKPTCVHVGRMAVQDKYLRLFTPFTDLQVLPDYENERLLLRFSEGDGVIMSLRQDLWLQQTWAHLTRAEWQTPNDRRKGL